KPGRVGDVGRDHAELQESGAAFGGAPGFLLAIVVFVVLFFVVLLFVVRMEDGVHPARPGHGGGGMAFQVGEASLVRGVEVIEEVAPNDEPVLAGPHAPADRVALVRGEAFPGWGEITVRVEVLGEAGAVELLRAHGERRPPSSASSPSGETQ